MGRYCGWKVSFLLSPFRVIMFGKKGGGQVSNATLMVSEAGQSESEIVSQYLPGLVTVKVAVVSPVLHR